MAKRQRPKAAVRGRAPVPAKARPQPRPAPDPAVACTDCGWHGKASAYAAGFVSDEGFGTLPFACPQCGSQGTARSVAELHAENEARKAAQGGG